MIETNKFFFNKDEHTELAQDANMLAQSHGLQVSRWVNNSNGRQIVTYRVHSGERNQFGSKQENVQFEVSEDAGRGNKIRDESTMLHAVIEYLRSIESGDDNEEPTITEFWMHDQGLYAGETQFYIDIDRAYIDAVSSFGASEVGDIDSFRDNWKLIDTDDFEDEYFRDNMKIDKQSIYDDLILKFVNINLAKYDEE